MNAKLLRQLLPLLAFCLGLSWNGLAQENAEKPEADHSYKPLTLKLSEDGKKYVRFIIWHQQWIQTNNLAIDNAPLQLTHLARRSRFLAYAQVSPRFLILTHFGLNNLTPDNLTSLGNNGDSPQLFLHDAWTEFKVSNDEALYIGGGLHYWKGLTRLASQSTLNFMTLDQARPFIHWHSLAVTDQFARHLGIYAKGQIDKLDYRLAINNPGANGLQNDRSILGSDLAYDGFLQPDKDGDPVGNTIYEGYFRYNFWDAESIKLPYNVGSYLGAKKIFAIGAGFFAHPNGMYNNATGEHENVAHFAVDAFLDMPLTSDDCLNFYASFINFNYGANYVSRWAGTGTALYGHVGYKLPASRFMPYVALQSGNYDGFEDNVLGLDLGVNYFILGHSAKLTLEYHMINNDPREGGVDPETGEARDVQQLRLQAHIFL
ncbi:MAG: porin [Phaeodactylibacter sp.]|nr:porin [Phaeodactylibacter sp.]